jgi:hypothetical protein
MENEPSRFTQVDEAGDPQNPLLRSPRRDLSHIQGWGADLDRNNRPGVPMERKPPRLPGLHWTHPGNQPLNIKVYHSTERPGVTPVFGTSTPPRGLSGKVRNFAYKLSENDVRHWLLLLFADRLDVVEGIGDDLVRGRIPNLFMEMGGKAELKHNRAGFVTKAVVATFVLAGVCLALKSKRLRR